MYEEFCFFDSDESDEVTEAEPNDKNEKNNGTSPKLQATGEMVNEAPQSIDQKCDDE